MQVFPELKEGWPPEPEGIALGKRYKEMGRTVKGKTGGWELAVPLVSDGYSVQNGVPCNVSLETVEHGLNWGNKVFMVKSLKMRSNGLPKSTAGVLRGEPQ